MNKGKVITDLLVISLAFILFLIWYESKFDQVDTTSSTTIENYKVYLITIDRNNEYAYLLNQGAYDMSQRLGIDYVWDAPSKLDVNAQINVLNNAVKNGADAILFVASDPVKVTSAIEDAKALGVKIIYVDSPSYEEAITTLATDNYAAGVTAAETMLLELKSLGIEKGSIGIVNVPKIILTTMNRVNGFRSVIEADGRFKLLDTKYTTGYLEDEIAAAQAFINENPDLVGLFGTNEGTTIGVGTAIMGSGKEIIGIGFDVTDVIQDFINNGSLKAVMQQSPYTMGYLGMAEAYAALNGYPTGSPFINTGITVRTIYTH